MFHFICTRGAPLWEQVHSYSVYNACSIAEQVPRLWPHNEHNENYTYYEKIANWMWRMETNRLLCRHQWTTLTVFGQSYAKHFLFRRQKCLSSSRTIRIKTKYNSNNTHTHRLQPNLFVWCVRARCSLPLCSGGGGSVESSLWANCILSALLLYIVAHV